MPKLMADGIEVEVPQGAARLHAWPIQGPIKHFRPELERRISEKQGEQLEAAE
jgi:hypothetical protein